MGNKTIWTVSQAYQNMDYKEDDDISSYTSAFDSKQKALACLREWIREQVEKHYEGNDDWTNKDTDAEVSEVFNRAEIRCGNMFLKWINDYEHLAWSLQGHKI